MKRLYKYIAISIILAVSFYIAFYIRRSGEEKLKFYTAMTDFIEYIKNQIKFFCTPTDEIIGGYKNEVLTKSGFLENIDASDWSVGIEVLKSNGYIDSRCAELLKSFSLRLGKTGSEEQIANCDYAIDFLTKEAQKKGIEIPKKTKVFSSLAVIFGFMAAIILL